MSPTVQPPNTLNVVRQFHEVLTGCGLGAVLGYATFCHIAGIDPLDAPPGLPSNADSLNSEPVDTSLHFHESIR